MRQWSLTERLMHSDTLAVEGSLRHCKYFCDRYLSFAPQSDRKLMTEGQHVGFPRAFRVVHISEMTWKLCLQTVC